MKLEHDFGVDAELHAAWPLLLDLERIAPCMPGAQLQEVDGDEYRGIVKVKVGPITAQYRGAARVVEADEATRRVVLHAEGRDTRGQGNAAADIVATLTADGARTQVHVDTELNVTGKVAQFGRGVMADVSAKLMDQFVACLSTTVLDAGDAGAAAPGPPRPAAAAPRRGTAERAAAHRSRRDRGRRPGPRRRRGRRQARRAAPRRGDRRRRRRRSGSSPAERSPIRRRSARSIEYVFDPDGPCARHRPGPVHLRVRRRRAGTAGSSPPWPAASCAPRRTRRCPSGSPPSKPTSTRSCARCGPPRSPSSASSSRPTSAPRSRSGRPAASRSPSRPGRACR